MGRLAGLGRAWVAGCCGMGRGGGLGGAGWGVLGLGRLAGLGWPLGSALGGLLGPGGSACSVGWPVQVRYCWPVQVRCDGLDVH